MESNIIITDRQPKVELSEAHQLTQRKRRRALVNFLIESDPLYASRMATDLEILYLGINPLTAGTVRIDGESFTVHFSGDNTRVTDLVAVAYE